MIGSSKMGRMPPSKHDFSRVPKAEIQRSSFDRSHTHKTMFDSGYLVPIFADEVLPGDTHSLNLSSFCRLSTPLKPVMDNMYMDVTSGTSLGGSSGLTFANLWANRTTQGTAPRT